MSILSFEDKMGFFLFQIKTSKYIFEKSEGNPLYLTYIIKTLISEEISLETFNKLPAYDFNLEKYYY